MRAEIAILFGGQGAYAPGALAAAMSDELAELLRVVDGVAAEHGRGPVSGLLRAPGGPSAGELAERDPFALQLAIFALGLAGEQLARRQLAAEARRVFVGHSMGEIAALTAAGAFELADGARLVAHRAEALAAALGRRRGGMVSLQLSAARTQSLVELLDDAETAVAVRNAPGLTVIAGPEEALAQAVRLADALGARAGRLPAPYAFHSPMLGVAAERFARAIGGIAQRPLRARVYSPVAQRWASDAMDLKQLLVRQLTAQVDFLAALRALHEAGVEQFVEGIPSGLMTLVKRSVPGQAALREVRSAEGAEGAEVPEVPQVAEARARRDGGATPDAQPMLERGGPGAERATSSASGAAANAPARASAAAAGAGPSLSQVLEQLRALYAETLGYPPEAITPEADLEADLGIDSLKRAEMLAKVTAHFQLKDADDGRYASHQTLAELAGLVLSATGPA